MTPIPALFGRGQDGSLTFTQDVIKAMHVKVDRGHKVRFETY